jgi:hypothetical protein
MNELLTMAKIKRQYEDEWVLVEDPELDADLEVVSGRVVWHSKDRDEVHHKALELRPRHPAFVYAGEIPEDAVIVV